MFLAGLLGLKINNWIYIFMWADETLKSTRTKIMKWTINYISSWLFIKGILFMTVWHRCCRTWCLVQTSREYQVTYTKYMVNWNMSTTASFTSDWTRAFLKNLYWMLIVRADSVKKSYITLKKIANLCYPALIRRYRSILGLQED